MQSIAAPVRLLILLFALSLSLSLATAEMSRYPHLERNVDPSVKAWFTDLSAEYAESLRDKKSKPEKVHYVDL